MVKLQDQYNKYVYYNLSVVSTVLQHKHALLKYQLNHGLKRVPIDKGQRKFENKMLIKIYFHNLTSTCYIITWATKNTQSECSVATKF